MQKNTKGFSLVEGVVALFVLSVGILGVTSLFTKGVVQSVDTGKNITALGFSQEGIELVRVIRNNDLVGGGSSDVFHSLDEASLGRGNNCAVDVYGDAGGPTARFSCYGAYNAENYRLSVAIGEGYYRNGVSSGNTNNEYAPFWRRVYIDNDVTGGRKVASVVFFKQPESAQWPSSVDDVETKCTPRNFCVFTKAVLQ